MTDEINEITKRYERRKKIAPNKYSLFNDAILATVQERQRILVRLLKRQGIYDLSDTRILEVGCGSGGNLFNFLQLGAKPENLFANELLPDRAKLARHTLPKSIKVLEGDATSLRLSEGTFDIVFQSTVFSSILDNTLQETLAKKMWNWVRPGGGILWYDFTFNNPSNPDVRGVPIKRVQELFPDGLFDIRRVTLAPPVARRAVKIHPNLYSLLNIFPFLRTHVFCYIKKL